MNIHKITRYLLMLYAFTFLTPMVEGQDGEPLWLAVAGVSHGCLWEVINRLDRGDFEIAGVAGKDDYLREHNSLRDKLDPNLFHTDLGEILDRTHPEVVIVYGPIRGHFCVVEACTPRGVYVTIGKSLAVNNEHATRMASFIHERSTLLLINYETTWYNINHGTFRLIDSGAIGKADRISVYDGHQGPFEISCGREFADWLTNPMLNGDGAVIDSGCYGVSLATRLMKDEEPFSVYAALRQNKPSLYPKADDNATIIVGHPPAAVQIMGPWCWSIGRKDMHIYGDKRYIYQDTPKGTRIYTNGKERREIAPPLNAPYSDSFCFLRAAVRKEIDVPSTDLSSLENNLMVVRILDVAIQSTKSKAVIQFF